MNNINSVIKLSFIHILCLISTDCNLFDLYVKVEFGCCLFLFVYQKKNYTSEHETVNQICSERQKMNLGNFYFSTRLFAKMIKEMRRSTCFSVKYWARLGGCMIGGYWVEFERWWKRCHVMEVKRKIKHKRKKLRVFYEEFTGLGLFTKHV